MELEIILVVELLAMTLCSHFIAGETEVQRRGVICTVRKWWGRNSNQVLEFQAQRVFSFLYLFFFHSLSLFSLLPEFFFFFLVQVKH